MWILGREWAKAVGPAKEASVGWCGWIPVGWLASKFWCQGPRNEARCRKSLVGGGVGGGKLYPKPQAGKNCTTNSSGNPMSAGRRRWAGSEGFQGGSGGAADQRPGAGPLAGSVFPSHAGRAAAGCGPGERAARREWSNFGIPKFGSLSSGPGGPESRPELFASGLACAVFSASPKSSGRNPSPVRESGPRSVVVEVVVL